MREALLDRPLRIAWLWNGTLLGERLVTKPEAISVGGDDPAAVPAPTEEALVVLEPSANGHRFMPDARLRGALWISGQRHDVSSLGVPCELGPHDYGLVQLGSVSLFFQPVRPAVGEVPRRPFRDGALFSCFGLSVFVHVVSLVFLFLVAARELAPVDDLELDAELMRKFLVTPPPSPMEALRGASAIDEQALRARDEAAAKRAERDEGKLGERNARHERTELAGAPADAVAQKVRGLGLLGVLHKGGASPLGQALQGPSVEGLLGGLGSLTSQVGVGSGGLGLRGGGIGGGAKDGTGVIYGAGEMGTAVAGGKGHGKGTGGGGRGAKEAQLDLQSSGARVSGFLSKEQINRVVQANRAAIKYCYESALQHEPGLSGALHAQWRIDRGGKVTTVRVGKSTLGNAKVEGCVLRQIKRWQFPKPDGGEVDVEYPFLFRGGV